MNETATLRIRADSDGLDTATGRLGRLEGQGRKTERATGNLTASFGKMMGVVGGITAVIGAVVGGFQKVVAVQREFDVLNASLITATGSAESATGAFRAIQDFATKTPYSLQQATEGFTKLVNLGLVPSEHAMMSYGNTAAAMGKDLSQMIEAVADAATGEFERLKEFGIKARNQGDTIAFTFRGVTTTVANNASEIEGYLTALGDNEFAGAMEKRMATLDGAISNLGDQWNAMWLSVSQSGIGDAIQKGVRMATSALADLTDSISSGQLTGYLESYAERWKPFTEAATTAFNYVTSLWDSVPKEWKEYGEKALALMIEVWTNYPAYVRSWIQRAVVEFASIVDYGKAYGAQLIDVMVAKFDELVEKTKVYGKAIGQAINPFSDGDYNLDAELANVSDKFAQVQADIFGETVKQVEATRKARLSSIADINAERQASVDAAQAIIDASDAKLEAYRKEREERSKDTSDRLAGFYKGAGNDSSKGPSARQQSDFAKLVASLRSEEQVIEDSYNKRRELILANTEAESDQQQQMLARVAQMRDDDLAKLQEKRLEDINRVRESLMTEEEELQASYERKKAIILNSTEVTETQRSELMARLNQDYDKRQKALETKNMSERLKMGQELFGGLSDIAKTFAGEQSGVYKAMFAVSKAFAIADSIIKIQQGIAAAAATPWPANLAAIASTVAATGSVLSTISSTTMSGYKTGGYTGDVSADSIAGVVHGQEYVFDAASTRSIGRDNLESIRRGEGLKGNVSIVVNNNAPGVEVTQTVTQENDETKVEFIIEQASNQIATQMREGHGPVTDALESTYDVRRAG